MKNHKTKNRKTLRKLQKRFVTTFLIVGVVTTIGVIVFGIFQLRNVFNPISTHADTQQIKSVNLDSNTIIIAFENDANQIQQVHIVGLNTIQKELRELVIPGNTLTQLPLGLDTYQVKHIFNVTHLDPNKLASNQSAILQQSLQNITGTICDDVIIIRSKNTPPIHAIDWLSNPVNIFQVLAFPDWVSQNIITQLTRAQFAQYMYNISSTKPYKVRTHDLSESYIKDQITLKDGTKVFQIDQSKGDRLSQELFEQNNLVQENIPIRIINTTQTGGLAKHVQRLLQNAGAQVVETSSTEDNLSQTTILLHTDNLSQSQTFSTVQNLLYVPANTQSNLGNFHYKISIMLGQDFAKFLHGN